VEEEKNLERCRLLVHACIQGLFEPQETLFSWHRGRRRFDGDHQLGIGRTPQDVGLVSGGGWTCQPFSGTPQLDKAETLRVGDEIRVKIVEKDSVDKPIDRQRADSARDLENQKAYVRAAAKQLGWTVRERPGESKSLHPKEEVEHRPDQTEN
jgi:hypothetical protein